MPMTTRPGRLAGQTRRLLRCGVWAGPVFTATFVAEGAAREGYRPLRHPVSSLALGPRGWVQTANFAVTGVLCLAGAAGLRRTGDRLAGSRAGPVMVAAAGAGLIGSAAFRTDPVGGEATSVSRTTASPGGSGKVRVPGLGHERQECVKFLIGLERAVAQLVDRGNRVRTGRVADQLIQRHQITMATGIRYLSGIHARDNHLHRPLQLYALRHRSDPA